jgi:hypothetical protein
MMVEALEAAINEMLNSIFDRITARANFPIAYDKST